MPPPEKEESLTLEILEAIEADSRISQRGLARQLGVALGLANSYLRRCVRKGLIKVQEAPANRYLYYLTPKGFAEKSRLTAEYLSYSFDYYRRAGESLRRVFDGCRERGQMKVVLCGVSELAEIALLRASEYPLQIIAIYDPFSQRKDLLGVSVQERTALLPEHQICVFTALKDQLAYFEKMEQEGYMGAVDVPDILGLKAPGAD